MGAGKGRTRRVRLMGITPVRTLNDRDKARLITRLGGDAVLNDSVGRLVDYLTRLRARCVVEDRETEKNKGYLGMANSLAKTVKVKSGRGYVETLAVLTHETAHILTPNKKLLSPRYDRKRHNATSYLIDRRNDRQFQSELVS